MPSWARWSARTRRHQTFEAEERAASYVDASHAEAVEEVFDRYQIPFEGDATDERFEQDRFLLVQRGSDWRFVTTLASNPLHDVFYLEVLGTEVSKWSSA